MVNVSLRVVLTRVTSTALDQRGEIPLELGARHVEPTRGRINRGVARHPRRIDAIKRVRARFDAGEEVIRLGDAEHVARLVLWQLLAHPGRDRGEVLLFQRAADAEAIEALAFNLHRPQISRRLPAQILVLCALDHPKKLLVWLTLALLG